jgi:hypothetical protein
LYLWFSAVLFIFCVFWGSVDRLDVLMSGLEYPQLTSVPMMVCPVWPLHPVDGVFQFPHSVSISGIMWSACHFMHLLFCSV